MTVCIACGGRIHAVKPVSNVISLNRVWRHVSWVRELTHRAIPQPARP